jgi:hypothetical protein
VPTSFWRHCRNPKILRTSVKTALLVGTILAAINHYEAILAWSFTATQKIKIAITYLVPFSVATYAAARHAQRLQEQATGMRRGENVKE